MTYVGLLVFSGLFEMDGDEEVRLVEVWLLGFDWGEGEEVRGAELVSAFVGVHSGVKASEALYVVFPEGVLWNDENDTPTVVSDSFLEWLASEGRVAQNLVQNLLAAAGWVGTSLPVVHKNLADAGAFKVVVFAFAVWLKEALYAGVCPSSAEVCCNLCSGAFLPYVVFEDEAISRVNHL